MARSLFGLLILWLITGCALVPPPAQRTNVRDIVVDEAMAQLDRPYQYGGSDPTGFDNDGLVQYVFGRAGVDLPRSAGEQHAAGSTLGHAAMRRGDLLFYTIEGKDRPELHVCIFVGKGRMVHIQKDGRVELVDVDSPYWQRRYLDGVSVLP